MGGEGRGVRGSGGGRLQIVRSDHHTTCIGKVVGALEGCFLVRMAFFSVFLHFVFALGQPQVKCVVSFTHVILISVLVEILCWSCFDAVWWIYPDLKPPKIIRRVFGIREER